MDLQILFCFLGMKSAKQSKYTLFHSPSAVIQPGKRFLKRQAANLCAIAQVWVLENGTKIHLMHVRYKKAGHRQWGVFDSIVVL